MDLPHWIWWHTFDRSWGGEVVTLLLPDNFCWVGRADVKNRSLKCSIHSGKASIYFFPWEFWVKHQHLPISLAQLLPVTMSAWLFSHHVIVLEYHMMFSSKIRFDPFCPYRMEKEGKYSACSGMTGIIGSSQKSIEKNQILWSLYSSPT